jgi:hypothetical protein
MLYWGQSVRKLQTVTGVHQVLTSDPLFAAGLICNQTAE